MALPNVPREITTPEEAVAALRMALGMAIQVIVSPDSYDTATIDHVRREAVATNLTTAKFESRHAAPPETMVSLVQPTSDLSTLVLVGDAAERAREILARHGMTA